MGIYSIKPLFQKSLAPIAHACISLKIHPDYINLAGLLVSLGMAVSLFFAKDIPALFWILPIGAFVRTACNALDGMVARGLSVSSPMGEVYNELLDRISDAAIFASVGISGLGNIENAFAATVCVLLNSYVGILAKAAGGKRIYAGIIGKADRMILIGLAGIISFFYFTYLTWDIFLWVILAGSVIAILQRLSIIRKDLNT
jgi:CDP-diacylglycerol---glycerol-3-phosphate 3-phosphatidyltransferase